MNKKLILISGTLDDLLKKKQFKSTINELELYGTEAVLSAIFDVDDLATAGFRYRNAYCHYLYDSIVISEDDDEEIIELCFNGIDGNIYLVTSLEQKVYMIKYDTTDISTVSDFEPHFNNE